MRLNNKVAVITGAASGMGRAMVVRFAEEGAFVVGGDIVDGFDDLPESVARRFTGVRCDVSDRGQCEALIDRAVALHGGVDILCNNAGIFDRFMTPAMVTDEMWRKVMSVNIDGPMYLTRHALPRMLERGGGSIVNTASLAGTSGATGGAAYVASKHALVGLTRHTAWIYATQGIRCNAIAPGGVATNITAGQDPLSFDALGMGRGQGYIALMPQVLEPLDIANLALFLASDEARHINGAIIPADAGWRAT